MNESSAILANKNPVKKRQAKSKRIRRRRKAKAVTLTEAVRRVFAYQRENAGRFGVFSINRDLSICKADGVRFELFKKCYPDDLIGIYDKNLRICDLIDDLSDCFFDGAMTV